MPETERDNPGLLMPPPLFSAVAMVLAVALEFVAPFNFLITPGFSSWQVWVGVALVIAGGALAFPAVGTFQARGTNVDPGRPATKLVTDGLYRFSRNPMYLGCLSFYFGVNLIFALEWGVIALPSLCLAFDRMIVAKEEDYLGRKFGREYAAFKSRTRRWI